MKISFDEMTAFFIFLLLLLINSCSSSYDVSGTNNIETQPGWGPTGYDYVEYYYLPDIEVYYFVPDQVFIYQDNDQWIRSRTLPLRYRDFDLDHAHKVVVNQREPFMRHVENQEKYSSFKSKHDQQPIRESTDKKYFINKDHPQHQRWIEEGRQKGEERH